MITYQDCVEITKKNSNFYEKIESIDGYKISIFNYILSIHDFFRTPFEGSKNTAHELRGITFVHHQDGTTRFAMLSKFFNLNEIEENQFHILKDKKIISISDKADGSMIRFIQLPNGRILAKTKQGLSNQQCLESQSLYEANESLQLFVKETLDQGLAAIFELTSPHNRIVLNYSKSELVLTQIRDENTGKYLDAHNHPLVLKYGIKCVKKYPEMTLEELVAKQQTEEGIEGFVVTFEDGQMIKIKTKWYMDRHRVLDKSTQEDEIVKMILEETLDDSIAILDKDNERRIYAEEMQIFMSGHLRGLLDQVKVLLSEYKGSRKDFALAHKTNPLFPIAVNYVEKMNDIEGINKDLKSYVQHKCRRLEMTKDYLKSNGFKVKEFSFIGD